MNSKVQKQARALALLIFVALFLFGCKRQQNQTYSGDSRKLRRAQKDDVWGYIDASGKFVIQPQFC